MAQMVQVKCKCCGNKFMARVADRKRGWGKFCSKSCKAIKQESRTGQYKEYMQKRKQSSNPNIPRPLNVLAFGENHDDAAQANDHSLGEDEMSWGEDYYDKQ